MKYKFVGKSLFFPKEKKLVIADLHLGYEEALNEAGIFLPRRMLREIVEEMNQIFKKVGKINKVIILGDLKHEFGKISRQEWKESLEFIDFLLEKSEKILLIKGNHDTILEPIVRKKEVEIKDFYVENEKAFFHGHKLFHECLEKKIKLLIVGHKHPAITIKEGVKAEIYKCFLEGKWKGKKVVILPSFFPLVEGSDIFMFEDTNLAFKPRFSEFEVYVPVSVEKVYNFGKVKKVGRLLG